MTKYEELKTFIADLQEGEGKLPWTEIAEEHARLEKEIREAYANKELSVDQQKRLLDSLP